MSVETEISRLLEARVAAIAAHDVDGVMQQVAEDVISFDVGKPLVRSGSAAVRQQLEAWFAGYDGPIGFELRDLVVRGDGNAAFSHALVRVSGTLKSGVGVSRLGAAVLIKRERARRGGSGIDSAGDP